MANLTIVLIALGAGILAYCILNFIIGYLERPKNPKTAIVIDIIGVILLLAILAGGYFYFFVISPAFIGKPYIEKPELYAENASTKEEIINCQHVQYLANEIGGYKLHDDPLSKTPPEFEFVVTDFNRTYTLTVIDHKIQCRTGEAADADFRLYGKQQEVILIFQADDMKSTLKNLIKENRFWTTVFKDDTTLALKGYKSVYDEIR